MPRTCQVSAFFRCFPIHPHTTPASPARSDASCSTCLLHEFVTPASSSALKPMPCPQRHGFPVRRGPLRVLKDCHAPLRQPGLVWHEVSRVLLLKEGLRPQLTIFFHRLTWLKGNIAPTCGNEKRISCKCPASFLGTEHYRTTRSLEFNEDFIISFLAKEKDWNLHRHTFSIFFSQNPTLSRNWRRSPYPRGAKMNPADETGRQVVGSPNSPSAASWGCTTWDLRFLDDMMRWWNDLLIYYWYIYIQCVYIYSIYILYIVNI